MNSEDEEIEAGNTAEENTDSGHPNETNDEPTTDSNEQLKRIRKKKAKQLESEDFTLSPEEIERRKREATETEFQ